MKVVIDARLYSQSGVGRYLQQLIKNLAVVDSETNYLIYLKKEDYSLFPLPAKNFEKKLVDIHWHSLREQIILPLLLIKDKPDLVHFPYFSVPIIYPGRFIVTIHDLIIDHFDTGRASTHNWLFYKLKRWFYKTVMKFSLSRAKIIIAVSQSTKKEIIAHYQIDSDKIAVIYEAAELQAGQKLFAKTLVSSRYLLYVGNAYPHKNLERLIEAMDLLKKEFYELKLVLVGKKDFFYQRFEKKLTPSQKEKIIFFGFANDQQLANLYHHAQAFVFPSLMEGFGLPPLEAMSLGCPVVAARTSSVPEICGEAALYFDPQNTREMATKISQILDNNELRKKLIGLGHKQVAKYSWLRTAQETLKIYKSTGYR